MPTTYAHYSLGQKVRQAVGKQQGRIIESYPELFNIGLHGPDLLFYYNALTKNAINQLGFRLHELPGSLFFQNAAAVIRKQERKEPCYAYIYGFICHFSLDVCCHGYIDEKIKASGVSHAEIEAELDRELMVRDGLDPIRHKVTGHLVPSEENAEVIQAFFPNIEGRQIYKCMKDMVFYLNMLTAPSKLKRNVIFAMLRAAGHYEGMHGLIINYEKNPLCEDSTERLIMLYQDAVRLALQLIGGFEDCVKEQTQLEDIYEYNFSSIIPAKEEKQA